MSKFTGDWQCVGTNNLQAVLRAKMPHLEEDEIETLCGEKYWVNYRFLVDDDGEGMRFIFEGV